MIGHAALDALDVTTLFVIGTCITALLGLLLISAWMQERIRALAWWGAAYLLGGFSVALWSIEGLIAPPLPVGIANAALFVACGMIWNAARIFHGRRVLWLAMFVGAVIWLAACLSPDFAHWPLARLVLSSIVVSVYTFLTAVELWRERRKALLRRWPTILVPVLHGAVFLLPIPIASLLPVDDGIMTLSGGWLAMFVLEAILYVVGTAFIVLVLAKEHSARLLRDAASTDELTGLLNRRGFFSAAHQLAARRASSAEPVSVLMFDLDHFKSINDRFGHQVGDAALRLFGQTAASNMRAADIVGRFGGEEFVALLPASLTDATMVAERVRLAFQAAAGIVADHRLDATVSIGAAGGCFDVAALITAADGALYRAKAAGRNCVHGVEIELPNAAAPSPVAAEAGAERSVGWPLSAPVPAN